MLALCLIRVEMETKRAPLKVSSFLIEDFTQAIEINPVKIYARVSFKLVVLLLSFLRPGKRGEKEENEFELFVSLKRRNHHKFSL